MTASRMHLFSDGQIHVAYNPETMGFFRLDDQAWEASRVNGVAVDSPLVSNLNSACVDRGKPSNPIIESQVSSGSKFGALERLVLMVTTHCNLRCRYCYAEGGAYGLPPLQMSAELARRAVDWTLQHFSLVAALQFFGGEPTLNLQAIRVICETFEQHHSSGQLDRLPQYAMVTNGTFLSPRLEELIRQYKVHLTYSIDGPAEVHDRNRFFVSGRGSYKQTVMHFQRVRHFEGQSVGVEMTFSPQALDAGCGVWELAQFSRTELGLPEPHIAPVSSESGNVTSWDGRVGEAVASYRTAAAHSLQSILAGQYVGFSIVAGMLRTLILKRARGFMCPAGANTLAVDPRGDVYPCFMFVGQPALRLGNVNVHPDRELLEDRLQAFMHHNRKDTHATCRNCWALSLCSGCMGDTQMSVGTLEGESPMMCAVMKAVAEETMLFLARIRNDAAVWKRFVLHYRQWRLDMTNPVHLV